MQFSEAKDLIDILRDKFFHRLKAKAGWGKLEIQMEFEKAISDTFIAEWDKRDKAKE